MQKCYHVWKRSDKIGSTEVIMLGLKKNFPKPYGHDDYYHHQHQCWLLQNVRPLLLMMQKSNEGCCYAFVLLVRDTIPGIQINPALLTGVIIQSSFFYVPYHAWEMQPINSTSNGHFFAFMKVEFDMNCQFLHVKSCPLDKKPWAWVKILWFFHL